jgi:hypothetical protein
MISLHSMPGVRFVYNVGASGPARVERAFGGIAPYESNHELLRIKERHTMNLGLGGIVGSLVGIAVVLLRERWR